MREYRKFCRPKTTKSPQIGDVEIQLKCGSIVYVKYQEFLKRRNSFKIKSFVGEDSNLPGNILVQDKETGKKAVFSIQDYSFIDDQFEIISIIGNKKDPLEVRSYVDNSQGDAQEGDIILHNSELNIDAVFSYNNWLKLSDSWDLVGLQDITTYEEEEAQNGYYVIMANGHTLIIKPEDYSKVSDDWEHIDTIILSNLIAVDLGLPSGTLWADRNVDATAPEEDGSYFSWGNITGHKSTNGSTFDDSYDWGSKNNGPYASTPGASIQFTSQHKNADYATNSGYDAAHENLGGSWRMPTENEFQELYNNTDNEWTSINGVYGRKFMKKSDHSVYVFFPAAGRGYRTSLDSRGFDGSYWSSSLYSADRGYNFYFDSSNVTPQNYNYRYYGCSVRAVQSA